MYNLKSEDLSHLGGPMGSEYTTINYVKTFSTIKLAKEYAETEYGKKIEWKKPIGVITSGDLAFVMYTIFETKVDEKYNLRRGVREV